MLLWLLILIAGTAIILAVINRTHTEATASDLFEQYSTEIDEARAFITEQGLASDLFILIDLARHSGTKRLFALDLRDSTLVYSCMTTHGSGGDSSEGAVTFSNTPDSHCSSLGRYLVGTDKMPSPGFGSKYILSGLDSTNSNAEARDVVLHPWFVVPSVETIYPISLIMSWGCPAVSSESFEHLHQLIQSASGGVLLQIVYHET